MSDGSGNSLQAVINAANSGDTLLIASGVYQFNPPQGRTLIQVNKSLNFATQANGFPASLIGTYGPPVPSPSNGYASSLPVTIQNTGGTPSGIVIQFTSGTDGHIRVDGIQFQQVGNNAGAAGDMCLGMDRSDTNGPGSPGTQYTVIFTNCIFESGGVFNYLSYAGANGIVMSHCTFDSGVFNADSLVGVSWTTSKYGSNISVPNGSAGSGGHFYWNTPDTMGLGVGGALDSSGVNVGDTASGWCGVAGLNCTYIEDSTIINGTSGAMNGDDNSRIVVRHCNVIDSSLFSHGQDTGPSGNRHYEVYNNLMQSRGNSRAQHWWGGRGAVFLVANNQMDATNHSSIDMQCQQCRRSGQPPCQVLPGPANRQVGIGWSASSGSTYGNPSVPADGTGQVVDPCYFWNNTGTGGYNGGSNPNYWGISDYGPDDCGHGLSATEFIIQGTHFFVEVPRPGWQPYTYPHPLLNTAPQPPPPPSLQYNYTGPTPSFVQGNSFSAQPATNITVFPCTYNNAQVAGNTNIIVIWLGSGNVLAGPPTDTSGNTYTLLYNTITPSFSFNLYVYIAQNIKAAAPGANTVTATQTSAFFGEMNILEYSSVVAVSPLDVTSSNGSGTAQTSGNSPVQTTNNNDLVISGSIYNYPLPGTVTPPAGWNLATTATTNPFTSYGTSFVADQQEFSTGIFNPIWTMSPANQWAVFSLALKSTLVNAVGATSVPLLWTTSGSATSYTLSYGQVSGGPYPNTIPGITANQFIVTGLASGTYYFVVQGVNSVGSSTDSNEVAVIVSAISSIEITLPQGTLRTSGVAAARTVLRPLVNGF